MLLQPYALLCRLTTSTEGPYYRGGKSVRRSCLRSVWHEKLGFSGDYLSVPTPEFRAPVSCGPCLEQPMIFELLIISCI